MDSTITLIMMYTTQGNPQGQSGAHEREKHGRQFRCSSITSANQSGNEVTTSTLLIYMGYIYPIKLCMCRPEQDIDK